MTVGVRVGVPAIAKCSTRTTAAESTAAAEGRFVGAVRFVGRFGTVATGVEARAIGCRGAAELPPRAWLFDPAHNEKDRNPGHGENDPAHRRVTLPASLAARHGRPARPRVLCVPAVREMGLSLLCSSQPSDQDVAKIFSDAWTSARPDFTVQTVSVRTKEFHQSGGPDARPLSQRLVEQRLDVDHQRRQGSGRAPLDPISQHLIRIVRAAPA